MSTTLDVRGLSCPQPVIEVQRKLAQMEKGVLEVYLDSGAAKENISRMAKKNGWNVETSDQPDGFLLTLSKP
jgi:tRNA 2-thiouridine synthesizing protein A